MNDIRTEKYTMEEFKAIPRYANGRIVDLYEHFLLLTDEQIDMLDSDDWSYYYEMQDELEYELACL
jgi:hypothetical protein